MTDRTKAELTADEIALTLRAIRWRLEGIQRELRAMREEFREPVSLLRPLAKAHPRTGEPDTRERKR